MRQSLSSVSALRRTVVTTTLLHQHRLARRAGQPQELDAHHHGGSALAKFAFSSPSRTTRGRSSSHRQLVQ
eukprot:7640038-Heterocapsa_arctica.AAC.1